MNRFILILTASSFASTGFAADCGIKPKGMDFGANCELIRVAAPPPKKAAMGTPLEPSSALTPPAKKRAWEPILFGAYAGKPGYYAMIGTAQDLKVDASLMNEEVMEKALKATHDLKLGGVVACEAVGMQQSVGYTLFDLRNCGEKK